MRVTSLALGYGAWILGACRLAPQDRVSTHGISMVEGYIHVRTLNKDHISVYGV